MGFKSFKIIPVLVFVALLSFSIRLVEVFEDVGDFSGVAFAEIEPAAGDAKPEGQDVEEGSKLLNNNDSPEPDMQPLGDLFSDDVTIGDNVQADLDLDNDFPEWRDPLEENPAYDQSRMAVFKDLTARRKDIEKKERELETRLALLQAAEKELDRKFRELTRLRQELEGLLEQQSEEEVERTRSLVKIYEGMKPKDAARIFNTLDLDILVDVIGQMSERKLSPILAAMNAERARTITIMLAEEKQLPSLP